MSIAHVFMPQIAIYRLPAVLEVIGLLKATITGCSAAASSRPRCSSRHGASTGAPRTLRRGSPGGRPNSASTPGAPLDQQIALENDDADRGVVIGLHDAFRPVPVQGLELASSAFLDELLEGGSAAAAHSPELFDAFGRPSTSHARQLAPAIGMNARQGPDAACRGSVRSTIAFSPTRVSV